MRLIIVDENKTDSENLICILQDLMRNSTINVFEKMEDAWKFTVKNSCDVVFLNPETENIKGLIYAEKWRDSFAKMNIIFTADNNTYSAQAFRLHCSGYLLKPITQEQIQFELDDLRYPVKLENALQVRAFGNFEVFANKVPLKFRYSKTRELLAYLVDRNGALCSNNELLDILWGENQGKNKHISYLKNLRADLIDVFKKFKCGDAIVRQRGKLGIITDKIECDYFNFLEGKAQAYQQYKNEYMAQYSWSKQTNDRLHIEMKKRRKG